MPLTRKAVELATHLVFDHGRNALDVRVYDDIGYIGTIENVESDYFLSYFEYGQNICEDKSTVSSFLSHLI